MPVTSPPQVLRFANFEADLRSGELRKNGMKIKLQEKPFQLLACLLEHAGELVTREELRAKLWPSDTFVDFDHSLGTAVLKLRQAMNDSAQDPRYVETVASRGYRFLPVVTPVSPASAQAAEVPALSAIPGAIAKRSAARYWLAGGIVVLALAWVATWLTVGRAALSFNQRDWVLITDFENQTGEPRFDQALTTALTVGLEQSKHANVFPRVRLSEVLQRMGRKDVPKIDEKLGTEICLRENIRGLIACNITRTGKQYEVVARLIDPQKGLAVRSHAERAATEDGILDALDRISKQVRQDLGESLYAIHKASQPLPQVTTTSLAALRAFADANALWNEGKPTEAVRLYQTAIAADSEFAMAHANLGSASFSHWVGDADRGKKEFEKALSLTWRVSTRERMHIQAEYASSLGHREDAMQLYKAYLREYPDDSAMRFNFASDLMMAGSYAEARSNFEEVLRVDNANPKALINLATTLAQDGRYGEALPYYAKSFEIEPTWITLMNLNHEYGVVLMGAGQREKARDVFGMAVARPDMASRGHRSVAILDLYEGQYRAAAAELRQAITLNEAAKGTLSAARDRVFLAQALDGVGAIKDEVRELDAAAAVTNTPDAPTSLLTNIGSGYVRVAEIQKAAQLLELAQKGLDLQNIPRKGAVDRLEGELKLAQGETVNGIAMLELAEKESAPSTALARDALAKAYEKAGQSDRAIGVYESFLGMRGEWLGAEPQQLWCEDHVRLAKLYAAEGQRDKAVKTVEELLQLWAHAEEDVLPLQEAQRLRATLR